MKNWTVFCIVAGAIAGGIWHKLPGALLGAVIGFFVGGQLELRQRIEKLEQAFQEKPVGEQEQPGPHATEEILPEGPADAAEPIWETVEQAPEQEEQAQKIPPVRYPEPPYAPAPQSRAAPPHSTEPDVAQKAIEYIKQFFTTGNVVVRIGLIILFFGVAFLLKYAASRGLFPVELRLCCVAAGGIALLTAGWRLRMRKPAYALLLQGGAIGILYLTVFAAVKLYGLIPAVFALALMVGIVVLAGMLAVLQDARSLAIFGAAGGFLAPVLVSTGGGSHVMLFSYYGLLNAGILGTAWFKSWRELNLTGFVFTFVIGAVWGFKYYQPAYFSTTEPFLILFFCMYALISILFALRQPPHLKGFVDGTLVFGLPLVSFGLQCGLARHFEYGIALSSLALAAFYILCAITLWKKTAEGLRLLTESFLASGVVFASLAIPFAFDRFWTAGSWALEGGALVWLGLRQKRTLARNFGLLLQVCAGVAMNSGAGAAPAAIPVVNAFYISCLLISLAAFLSNYCHMLYRDRLREWEAPAHVIVMAWAVIWWFGGGLREINAHAPSGHGIYAACVFLALSCGIMSLLQKKLSWNDFLYIPCGLLPGLILLAGGELINQTYAHPLARWGLAAWSCALGMQYCLLKTYEEKWLAGLLRLWHIASLLFVAWLLAGEAYYWVGEAVQGAATWRLIMLSIVPGAVAAALLCWGRRVSWPVQRFLKDYIFTGAGILCGYLLVWVLAVCLHKGTPSPLSYLPILNPLELAQIAALLVIFKWYLVNRPTAIRPELFWGALGTAVFLFLNAIIARTTHYWAQVPFSSSSIWGSSVFQTAASILWTLTALGAMVFAARTASRRTWFAGAALLGLVVLKLFTIDLDGRGTVDRIISFIVVGALMLVIGYFSPLPPRQKQEA